jgi:hypothetical protein
MEIKATAGAYAGERPFGRAANLPSTARANRLTPTWGRAIGAAAKRG